MGFAILAIVLALVTMFFLDRVNKQRQQKLAAMEASGETEPKEVRGTDYSVHFRYSL